jgi:hypothetical protein
MIIPEPPSASEAPSSGYSQSSRKYTRVLATIFVAIISTLACVTASTAVFANSHTASISSFAFSPCGDTPGLCP